MSDLNPDVQRRISEYLMADLWQTRQVAHPNYPGSKWVLVSPQLHSRLVMGTEPFDATARLSRSTISRPGHVVPQWQLVARLASPEMVLAMARTAEKASDSEPVAWSRRRLNRHLRVIGWRRSTSRLGALFGAATTWESHDGTYQLTVPSPSNTRTAAANLAGPDVLVSIEPTTPVAVVVGLVDAVANRPAVQAEGNAR